MTSKIATDDERPGRRVPMSVRTTEWLRVQLDRAAECSGRSLAQEIEFRLERSITEDRMRRVIREELAQATLRHDLPQPIGAVSLPNMSDADRAEWLRN
jgi:hypothetical protein